MANLYLSNTTFINAIDKNFGVGAANFIGEALKYYVVNLKK